MWKRQRNTRQITKAELQLYYFLQTRGEAQLLAVCKHVCLTRRQRAWICQQLHKQLKAYNYHVHYKCLQTGRARGVNRAFRETRMNTRQSLVLNNLSSLSPHTS